MTNYINDKQLRFLLIAPVFFKNIITYGITVEDVSNELTKEKKEETKQHITEINECSSFLNQFITDIKNKYNIRQDKFDKIVANILKKFAGLDEFYLDKQTRKIQIPKVVATFCFAYQYFIYDICEHKDGVLQAENDKFIIIDNKFLFFTDYARITLEKFIKPLRNVAYLTLDKYEKEFKINIDKFERKCMKNVDNYIEFFKNI